MSADSVPFSLPSDERLIQIFSAGVDACKYAYLYDPEFAEAAARIVVTTGAFDLQRRFEELGPVDFNVAGSDITSAVSVEWVRGFSTTTVTRRVSMATPSEMNELLRRQALRVYGKRVDAVINVTYGANPKNDVSATGLAVHFLGEAEAQGSAHRLEELESMRAKGLISEEEFQSLRAKVLRDLAQ